MIHAFTVVRDNNIKLPGYQESSADESTDTVAKATNHGNSSSDPSAHISMIDSETNSGTKRFYSAPDGKQWNEVVFGNDYFPGTLKEKTIGLNGSISYEWHHPKPVPEQLSGWNEFIGKGKPYRTNVKKGCYKKSIYEKTHVMKVFSVSYPGIPKGLSAVQSHIRRFLEDAVWYSGGRMVHGSYRDKDMRDVDMNSIDWFKLVDMDMRPSDGWDMRPSDKLYETQPYVEFEQYKFGTKKNRVFRRGCSYTDTSNILDGYPRNIVVAWKDFKTSKFANQG